MDLSIIKNGVTTKLSSMGIKTLDFIIDAPKPRHHFETTENKNGAIDLGTALEGRTMRAVLNLQSANYPQLRKDLFKLLDARTAIYVIDSREPGKRWLVKSEVYTPSQLTDTLGQVEIPFISTLAFGESISAVIQTYSTAAFTHGNSGDILIDPRELPLKITYTGASTNLQIKNTTTGDTWSYTGTTAAEGIIVLDGVRSTKNGLSIFANTNRKLITLAPGANSFSLVGTSGTFSLKFEYRNYYM